MPTLFVLALLAAEPAAVWSTSVKVPSQGTRTFHAKGVKKGVLYDLVTSGSCERHERRRYKRWRERINDDSPQVMGVDFRVTIGGLEPMPVDHEERKTSFRADRDDPDVTVEDRSTPQAGIRCTVTSLLIRRP